MPRYSWNTANVGVNHQSINQYILWSYVHLVRFYWLINFITFSDLLQLFRYYLNKILSTLYYIMWTSWSGSCITHSLDKGYSRNASSVLNLKSTFYYHHWVDYSDGGLCYTQRVLCILPVLGASALRWFIRYIFIEI
jgi:hypothetical protein